MYGQRSGSVMVKLVIPIQNILDQLQHISRRTGFKCEHVIIANCDFSPHAQLLERNV